MCPSLSGVRLNRIWERFYAAPVGLQRNEHHKCMFLADLRGRALLVASRRPAEREQLNPVWSDRLKRRRDGLSDTREARIRIGDPTLEN